MLNMKITKNMLKKIIQEELKLALKEASPRERMQAVGMEPWRSQGAPRDIGAGAMGGVRPGYEAVGKQGPIAMKLMHIERLLMQASKLMPRGCPTDPEMQPKYEEDLADANAKYEEVGEKTMDLIQYLYQNHRDIMTMGTGE
jgi:hypothetical protein